MKILLLHSLYPPHIGGGAEIVVRQLAEGLHARGHQVVVLATGPEAGLHLEDGDGPMVYRTGLHNLYWHYNERRPSRLLRLGWHWRDRYNPAMREPLRAVIARHRPDVVLCNNLTGWSVAAWDEITAAGLPIVQVLHDLYLLCPKDTMFKKGRSCQTPCFACAALRRRHATASGQVAAVVGVSRFVLERLTRQGYFAGAAQHVVHNCTDLAPVAPPPVPAPRGPLRFGYIGTLSENKGVHWLIEQFQALSIDATLSIAGRGRQEDESALKALADPARVRFVGYQAPKAFLHEIDVLVVPSLWAEPFGLVAIEACSQHVPVIATDMGGLPEIIQDNLNGLLCSPDDPDSLGRAMLRLALDRNLRERLARQARDSVAPFLDTQQMLDQYQSILQAALAGRRVQDDHPYAGYSAARIEPAGD